jgi:hypothetical protein
MKKHQALARLQQLIEPDLLALERNIIIADGAGFIVFGCYRIDPQSGHYRVSKHGDVRGEFAIVPTALSWCIADKYQQHQLSTDIMRLEQQKLLLQADIRTRAALSKGIRSADLRENVEAKIATRRIRLHLVDERLTKCVNLAKYWQQRGFNNETARTGRTPSHRSSR